jgi:uncharacterized iron-regulated protein
LGKLLRISKITFVAIMLPWSTSAQDFGMPFEAMGRPNMESPKPYDWTKHCYGYWQCVEDFDSATIAFKVRSHHPLAAYVYPTEKTVSDSAQHTMELGARQIFGRNVTTLKLFADFIESQLFVSGRGRDQKQEFDFLLLGEDHDNPDHHWVQAEFGKLLATFNAKKLSTVFEQLRSDQQPALDQFFELNLKTLPQATLLEFKRLTDWEKSGWQQYNYDPLFQAAIDAKLPIYAGDVTRDAILKVAKEGESALPTEDRARLKLDVPLGPKLDDASLSEIEEAHCGTMPKEAFTGMAYAQRYRDATLADNVLKAADKHGSAILIAGNGHVRTDRGVPWYIKQRAPNAKVISIMLIEVEDGKNDPEAYVARDPDGKPAVDYIIFTPGVTGRPDPCEKMRAKMGK